MSSGTTKSTHAKSYAKELMSVGYNYRLSIERVDIISQSFIGSRKIPGKLQYHLKHKSCIKERNSV